MKTLGFLIILSMINFATADTASDSVYDFKPTNIDGKEIPLSQYKGKVLLIVNTASECGYTPQYEGLQNLYKKFNEEGLVILGFPANNFGGQEPGTDKQIKKFCKVNYDISFPMFSKLSVKGEKQHALFTYLTSAPNPDFMGDIKWNFEKFLIGTDGKLIRRFRSAIKPESKTITKAIEKVLNS